MTYSPRWQHSFHTVSKYHNQTRIHDHLFSHVEILTSHDNYSLLSWRRKNITVGNRTLDQWPCSICAQTGTDNLTPVPSQKKEMITRNNSTFWQIQIAVISICCLQSCVVQIQVSNYLPSNYTNAYVCRPNKFNNVLVLCQWLSWHLPTPASHIPYP